MSIFSRRSRTKRQPTGRAVVLSPRDVEVFKLLNRYRYLRSTFLKAFLPKGNESAFIRRLGNLYHEEPYLKRPEQQYQCGNALYLPIVYELGDLARQALMLHGVAPFKADKQAGQTKNFAHALMICDVLASVELGCRCLHEPRFIAGEEIIAKAPCREADNPLRISVSVQGRQVSVVPDALFGLEYPNKSYRFFVLEVDRGTMPVFRKSLDKSSYHKKLLAYRQVVSTEVFKEHFDVPNLFVLNVTTSRERMSHIMDELKKMTEGKGNSVFLFKTMKGEMWTAPPADPHMISELWSRAGYVPFCIARA